MEVEQPSLSERIMSEWKMIELQKTIKEAETLDFACISTDSSCSSPSSSVTDDETKSKKSRRLQNTIEKIRSLRQKDEDSSGHGSFNETRSDSDHEEIIDVVTI